MVYEKFYGAQEYYWGWRCISCGDILDQIILENRRVYGKRGWLKSGGQEARETKKMILTD